jgi:pteridine reductase
MLEPTPVALITGAAKRVGCAVALRLAHAGFDIAFTYYSSSAEARDLENEIRKVGRNVLPLQVDLTQPTLAVPALSAHFRQTFSRLNILVNNASIYRSGDDDAARMHAIHVQAPLLLCRQFQDLLRSSRGHVINMVDIMAERPVPKYAAYCASKAGLANLTLSLARELAPQVTVNGIAPGVVQWPIEMTPQEQSNYLQRVPLGRAGTPEDVAELVLFLATRGTYITGQIIRLDGGRSLV